MTKVTKIYGPPGTGKTEKLIRRAMAYIRVGTPVNKIGYFAFKEYLFYSSLVKSLFHFLLL